MWGSVALFALFLVFIVAPLFTWIEERRHFKQISFVRTIVVVQAWILLTSLEALRLSVVKHVFQRDVRDAAHESCGAIARLILRVFFDGYEVLGKENLKGGEGHTTPVVIVANHQSMLDVAAIFCLELKGAWVAKTTVFMIPGVGWLMYMAGYVPVERKSPGSIKRMYALCKECVSGKAWSLVIFPQGTRSRQTTLPFKNGAYNLAAELRIPVLPVSIHIGDDIWLRGTRMRVRVHPPILGVDAASQDKVRDDSFETIIGALAADDISAGAVAKPCDAREPKHPRAAQPLHTGPSAPSASALPAPEPPTLKGAGAAASSSSPAHPSPTNSKSTSKISKRGRGTALILKATTAGTGGV